MVGNSWGTILGVLAVQQHPELFRAFVGTGQMVSPRETDRVFYHDTLAWARRTGDTALVDTLTASGPAALREHPRLRARPHPLERGLPLRPHAPTPRARAGSPRTCSSGVQPAGAKQYGEARYCGLVQRIARYSIDPVSVVDEGQCHRCQAIGLAWNPSHEFHVCRLLV